MLRSSDCGRDVCVRRRLDRRDIRGSSRVMFVHWTRGSHGTSLHTWWDHLCCYVPDDPPVFRCREYSTWSPGGERGGTSRLPLESIELLHFVRTGLRQRGEFRLSAPALTELYSAARLFPLVVGWLSLISRNMLCTIFWRYRRL